LIGSGISSVKQIRATWRIPALVAGKRPIVSGARMDGA